MNVALAVTGANPAKIDGIKISLLDRQKEIDMRRLLPAGVRMYTGDDFNYPELIEGDREGHSDALLGIFDAIAPAAFRRARSPGIGRRARFSRNPRAHGAACATHLQGPTRFYKTGLAFLAWLNGHQGHFVMVGGRSRRASVVGSRGNFPPCRCGRVVCAIRARRHQDEMPLVAVPGHARNARPVL